MSATADRVTEQPILLRDDNEGITTLTLNRPRNTMRLSGELLTELQRCA